MLVLRFQQSVQICPLWWLRNATPDNALPLPPKQSILGNMQQTAVWSQSHRKCINCLETMEGVLGGLTVTESSRTTQEAFDCWKKDDTQQRCSLVQGVRVKFGWIWIESLASSVWAPEIHTQPRYHHITSFIRISIRAVTISRLVTTTLVVD